METYLIFVADVSDTVHGTKSVMRRNSRKKVKIIRFNVVKMFILWIYIVHFYITIVHFVWRKCGEECCLRKDDKYDVCGKRLFVLSERAAACVLRSSSCVVATAVILKLELTSSLLLPPASNSDT